MEIAAESCIEAIKAVNGYLRGAGMSITRRSGSWCMMKNPQTEMLELHNVLITIKNPLQRWHSLLTRGILLETLDYMLGNNPGYVAKWYKIYQEYSAETGQLPYSYGQRIFGSPTEINQWEKVVELLRVHPTTRQACIVIHRPIDRVRTFVPCTYVFHFQVTKDNFTGENKLEMTSVMRSQDAYRGLPLDLFAWTTLHEQMSLETGIPLGEYHHFVCNLHYYKKDIEDATEAISNAKVTRVSRPAELFTKKIKAKTRKLLKHNLTWLDVRDAKLNDGEILEFIKGTDKYWKDYVKLLVGGKLLD